MTKNETIEDLEKQLLTLKKTGLMSKAIPAEVLLEKMLLMIRILSKEIDEIKCEETPFGCGECEQCKAVENGE